MVCSGSWQAGGAFLGCGVVSVAAEQVLYPTADLCQAGSSWRDSVSSLVPHVFSLILTANSPLSLLLVAPADKDLHIALVLHVAVGFSC